LIASALSYTRRQHLQSGALPLPTTILSTYPITRRLRTVTEPAEPLESEEQSIDDLSSFDLLDSDSDSEPTVFHPHRTVRRTMSDITAIATARPKHTYVPGKPPMLEGRAPAQLKQFLTRLNFYWKTKKEKVDDEEKIQWAGAGIGEDIELTAWFEGGGDQLAELPWPEFVSKLLLRSLPVDFVWDALLALRRDKQGALDWVDWSARMRGRQAEVGIAAVSDLELVREMLFNCDVELRKYLRLHPVLLESGLHARSLDLLGVQRIARPAPPRTAIRRTTGTTPPPAATARPLSASNDNVDETLRPRAIASPAVPAPPKVDFLEFDRVAREKWALIVSGRTAVAAQVASLSRGRSSTAAAAAGSPQPKARTTSTAPSAIAAALLAPTGPGARPGKLTDREKAYLDATEGCRKCRLPWQQHRSNECLNGYATTNLVVPASYVEGSVVARPALATPNSFAVFSLQDDDSDAHSSDFEDDPTASDDECVNLSFPPLSMRIGYAAGGTVMVNALADSGANTSVITDELVLKLGLVKRKLRVPKVVKLAIKGGTGSSDLTISSYVLADLDVASGIWSPGRTMLKVVEAGLDIPYDIILGCPFFAKHGMSIHLSPHPQLRITRPDSTSFDLFEPVFGPETFADARTRMEPHEVDAVKLAAIQQRISELVLDVATAKKKEKLRAEAAKEEYYLKSLDRELRAEFPDLFPADLPSVADTPNVSVRHRIELVEKRKPHNLRGYPCPPRYHTAWRRLLDSHLDAGRMRPSSSEYASPAFIIPKPDPTVLPRWVNDYRQLNANTVKDRTPLPLPDEILARIAQSQIWGKIDMTNSFFQTRMAEEDIAKTAVKTPWGLFEWVVMPMGLCNAPATHQRRVNEALGALIGEICYVYIDDIVIFSGSVEEHKTNARRVLFALRAAGLYCSPKKTDLFTVKTGFLGHVISRDGIAADPSKILKITNWTTPTTVKQLRGFLGLVQYLRKFIVGLAQQTAVLNELVKKGFTKLGHLWLDRHQAAFNAIKTIVTAAPCLRALDYASTETIWLMTDASNLGVGAVLLQGETWKTARPCGFYSRQYIPAELNYPTHEQELLAIVAALKAWRIELLGAHFKILTDHATLRNLATQPTLSKRQARWTETLADYDYELSYVPGEQNTVADSMSRYSFTPAVATFMVAGISVANLSSTVVERIKAGYTTDPLCTQMLRNVKSMPAWTLVAGVLYFENRIVVPADIPLREILLHDAHDTLGHLGDRKTYAALALSYFWPGLRRDCIRYVASCDSCQRNKARTTRVAGQLHPLPVPGRMFTDIAIDFVGPLPLSEGFDMLMTVSCRLTGYVRLIPCLTTDGALKCAERLYDGWHRFFGIPEKIVSDRDKLFVSQFWQALYRRMGTRLQMSTSFHPETDGRSEKTNKTAIQILRMSVSRNQKDWFPKLAYTEFAMNAAVNVATGKTPFEMLLGYTPTLAPSGPVRVNDPASVSEILAEREARISDARDALAVAKIRQAEQANAHRAEEPDWKVGDRVMIDSRDRRLRYKAGKKEARSAKLFARHDGPYVIVEALPAESRYRLQLSEGDRSFAKFHVSKLKRYVENDNDLFPNRLVPQPEAVIVGGEEEYLVDSIIDQKNVGRGIKYLVRWIGHPLAHDSWEPSRALADTEALDQWEIAKGRDPGTRA
jgi:hypothetical protein